MGEAEVGMRRRMLTSSLYITVRLGCCGRVQKDSRRLWLSALAKASALDLAVSHRMTEAMLTYEITNQTAQTTIIIAPRKPSPSHTSTHKRSKSRRSSVV
jgi:hypothetical protein